MRSEPAVVGLTTEHRALRDSSLGETHLAALNSSDHAVFNKTIRRIKALRATQNGPVDRETCLLFWFPRTMTMVRSLPSIYETVHSAASYDSSVTSKLSRR